MKNKKMICDELNQMLSSLHEVSAVWEGGSVASGYEDSFSDLDLMIVCNDDLTEAVIEKIENFIDINYSISRKFRVPEPSWHGFSQVFLQCKEVPEFFYFDICVLKESLQDKFLEVERHGTPNIWFDKNNIIISQNCSEKTKSNLMQKGFLSATQTDFITINEIRKAIARKRFIDAFPLYLQFIARNLTILLNIIHRPYKTDFGTRYIYRDYPASDYELVENSFKVNDIDELEKKFETAFARYQALKSEIELTFLDKKE